MWLVIHLSLVITFLLCPSLILLTSTSHPITLNFIITVLVAHFIPSTHHLMPSLIAFFIVNSLFMSLSILLTVSMVPSSHIMPFVSHLLFSTLQLWKIIFCFFLTPKQMRFLSVLVSTRIHLSLLTSLIFNQYVVSMLGSFCQAILLIWLCGFIFILVYALFHESSVHILQFLISYFQLMTTLSVKFIFALISPLLPYPLYSIVQ